MVYQTPGYERTVPEIRLTGKWLENLGFEIGERIAVSIENGKLTIVLESADTSEEE